MHPISYQTTRKANTQEVEAKYDIWHYVVSQNSKSYRNYWFLTSVQLYKLAKRVY